MNDATPPVVDTLLKKKKRGLFLPLALVFLGIAVVGFIASRAGLDKALVKQQIDGFIEDMQEKGRTQGRDINLTYGDLEVVGSFASKHVVMHNPILSIKPLNRKPAVVDGKPVVDALLVTTPTIAIYAQSMDFSSLRIVAPDPIDLAAEDAPQKSLLNVTSDMPLSVTIDHKKIGDVRTTDIHYQSPTQMLLTYLHEQQATGEEEATPTLVPVYQSLQIDMAKDGGVRSSMAADGSGIGEASIFFHDIVLTPKEAPEGAMRIAQISGRWSNQLNEKKLNALAGSFTLGPVTSANTAAPYLPVMVDIEGSYEGMLSKTPQSIAQVQTQELAMALKKFSITTKDASFNATGNFTANAADVLPVGSANIALTNAPFVLGELRKFGLLDATSEPLVLAALQQVTGAPEQAWKDINIAVERARGGSFKIGQTTFEELFALFLKHALESKRAGEPSAAAAPAKTPHLVPALPPVDKPKAAPIAVPDHGVRG